MFTSNEELLNNAEELINSNNFQEAKRMLKKLIRKGYNEAYFSMAMLYYNDKWDNHDYKIGFNYLLDGSNHGNSDCMNELGSIYKSNNLYNKAIDYYQKAAKLNNCKSLYYLGMMYLKGDGVEKNNNIAYNYLEKAAELGKFEAMNEMGDCYRYGIGRDIDLQKAIEWYKKGDEPENAYANNALGELYRDDLNDIQLAGEHFKKAFASCELFNPNYIEPRYNFACILKYNTKGSGVEDAINIFRRIIKWFDCRYKEEPYENHLFIYINSKFELADIYHYGYCDFDDNKRFKDFKKAEKLYKECIEYGNTKAMKGLANLYFEKYFVNKNNQQPFDDNDRKCYKHIFELYKNIVDKEDNYFLMNRLGLMYEYDMDVFKHDGIKAKYWYEKSAQKGYEIAMFNLGLIYYDGIVIEQDYSLAKYWFEKAAEYNYGKSMYYLATMYNFKEDYQKSCYWYERALTNINSLSDDEKRTTYNNLACLYLSGLVVEKDVDKAIGLYTKAIEYNCHESCNNLGLIYYDGIDIEQDYMKARYYFNKGAAGGNFYSMIKLGQMYEKGLGGEKDFIKAGEWYKKAADNNYMNEIYVEWKEKNKYLHINDFIDKLDNIIHKFDVLRVSREGQEIIKNYLKQIAIKETHCQFILHGEDEKTLEFINILKEILENNIPSSQVCIHSEIKFLYNYENVFDEFENINNGVLVINECYPYLKEKNSQSWHEINEFLNKNLITVIWCINDNVFKKNNSFVYSDNTYHVSISNIDEEQVYRLILKKIEDISFSATREFNIGLKNYIYKYYANGFFHNSKFVDETYNQILTNYYIKGRIENTLDNDCLPR